MTPRISTIVLSWNRAELLERTLDGFARTMGGPFELTVVDNGSTDGSRAVIERARRSIPAMDVILYAENRGGEAFNEAIERASGELIHLHENDIVPLPGWREYVTNAFDAFPGLGQLSLLTGVPTDDYPGPAQAGTLRFSGGTLVYEADTLTTTAVFRAELFRRHGLRVSNVPQTDPDALRFPADGRLSSEVKAAGYWCAWADRARAVNLGHAPAEFARDPEYYRRNYLSKPWIDIEHWRRRVAEAPSQPRPSRHSVVFPGDAYLQPDRTNISCAGLPSRLWSMFDSYTPAAEVLDLLSALVRAVKPKRVLDAGGWLGRTTVALAAAVRDNGFGAVDALAGKDDAADAARAAVAAASLDHLVTFRDGVGDVPAGAAFDFAVFDRRAGAGPWPFAALRDGAMLVLVGPDDGGSPSVAELVSRGELAGFPLQVPRGLFVGVLRKGPGAEAGAGP